MPAQIQTPTKSPHKQSKPAISSLTHTRNTYLFIASQASSAAGEISKSRSGDRETARVDPAGAESGSRAVKWWEQMLPSVVVGGQAATMEVFDSGMADRLYTPREARAKAV
jgi:hypothetical protein